MVYGLVRLQVHIVVLEHGHPLREDGEDVNEIWRDSVERYIALVGAKSIMRTAQDTYSMSGAQETLP